MVRQKKINFFVPLELKKGGKEMWIKGICSSDSEDSDGEILEPSGFDFAPLLKSGYFNWNHKSGERAGSIIGRPTAAKVINGGKDFFVEGYLYSSKKEAQEVWDLAETLEKEDPERQLGFSIEGTAIKRDAKNPKRVLKAIITDIAITHRPKNSNTLLQLIKGEVDGDLWKDYSEGEEETEIVELLIEGFKKWFDGGGGGEGSVREYLQNEWEDFSSNDSLVKKICEGLLEKNEKKLSKIETINKIVEKYGNKNTQTIYKFVNKFNKEKETMEESTLKKAFDILDELEKKEGIRKEAKITKKKHPNLYDLENENEGGEEIGDEEETIEKAKKDDKYDKVLKAIESQNIAITKLAEIVRDRFEEEDSKPIRKSLIKTNSNFSTPVERFSKSKTSKNRVYSLENVKDRKDLCDRLFVVAAERKQKGGDKDLENIIESLEISKSIETQFLPKLQEMGIEIE
jgi:hypothetical protein